MPVALNRTIVPARDPQASAAFLGSVLGPPGPGRFSHFHTVELDHDATRGEHYAFLVSEAHFDRTLARLDDRGLPHWADPAHRRPGINHADGGRGCYWSEIVTRPYGSAG